MDSLKDLVNRNIVIIIALIIVCILILAYCCYRNAKHTDTLVARRVGPRFNEGNFGGVDYWSNMYSGGVWQSYPCQTGYTKEGLSRLGPKCMGVSETGAQTVTGIVSSGANLRLQSPRSDSDSDWSVWGRDGETNWRQMQALRDYEHPTQWNGANTNNMAYVTPLLNSALHGN